MLHPVRLAVLALSVAVACVSFVASAEVETDDEGFTSFEDVDSGKTHSLDEVDTGHTRSLDSVDDGRTEALDSVDDGRTEALDSVDTGHTDSLDAVDTGHTQSLDAAEAAGGPWQPPACGSFELALGPLPEGSDSNAWADRLRTAQLEIQTSERELEQADAAYSRARNFRGAVGTERADIIEARNEARAKFRQARCALPELVERARRAGVAPGLLRRYQQPAVSSH